MSIKIKPIDPSLNKKDFRCGKEMLDNYLHFQASQNVKRKLCVVFAMPESSTIKGYYTLSNASVPAEMMPESLRKKMPKSYQALPVTLIGRLAVDTRHKGQGLGGILLVDALRRSYDSSRTLGSIGVIVDPIDDETIAFYDKFGFILLPGSGKMFLPMADIAKLAF
jgi:GNAT superfamily N-acetyltransferase